MILLMIMLFFLLLIMGVPIPFSMGSSACLYMLLKGFPISMAAQRFFSNSQSFPFLAVPFFIFCGNLMIQTGIAQRIIKLSSSLVRHLPGGLGLVSCVTSMIMAGVSGSSVADASGVGSILIPAMNEEGYDKSFSATINATTSVLGIIIPPSSTMVILGWVANLSIGKLFLSGAIPGIIIGVGFFVLTIYISKKRGYPRGERATFQEIIENTKESIWALILPIFIIGSIVLGIATVTEVAAISAVYSLIVSKFIYKSLNLKNFLEAAKSSAYATAMVMSVVCMANIFTWVLIIERVPDLISSFMLGLGLPSWALLLAMIIIMLISGTFMDLVPNIFLFVPIFFPIAKSIGLDPIHFGLVTLVTLAIGLFTPPVGTTLIISCHLAGIGIEETIKDLIPFFVLTAVLIIVMAYLPQVTLWLPNLLLN